MQYHFQYPFANTSDGCTILVCQHWQWYQHYSAVKDIGVLVPTMTSALHYQQRCWHYDIGNVITALVCNSISPMLLAQIIAIVILFTLKEDNNTGYCGIVLWPQQQCWQQHQHYDNNKCQQWHYHYDTMNSKGVMHYAPGTGVGVMAEIWFYVHNMEHIHVCYVQMVWLWLCVHIHYWVNVVYSLIGWLLMMLGLACMPCNCRYLIWSDLRC